MKIHKIIAVISAVIISTGFVTSISNNVSASQDTSGIINVQTIKNYLNGTTTPIAEGYSYDGKYYLAGHPAAVSATFVVNDTKNKYVTGFECWIEKYENKKWTKVKPLGNVIQVNGMDNRSHFYNIEEDGRKHVQVDLACYPLLSAGNYRIAKPFWKENDKSGKQYVAYYDFEMVNSKQDYTVDCSITLDRKEYPIGTEKMIYNIDYSKGLFARSDIINIERKVVNKWISVRTSDVYTNSISGYYAFYFAETEEVDVTGFDLSKAGEYRMRFSINGMDGWDLTEKQYDTKYVNFKITDKADLGNVKLKMTNTDMCEIDHDISVDVTNNSSSDIKLEKAVLSYKTSDGKTKSRDCTVYSYSSVYSNRVTELNVTSAKDLPIGNVTLKLTFSADGCKNKTFSTTFKVRKATNAEKSSGVFVSDAVYDKNKNTVTVTVTNKLRSKETIVLDPRNQYILTAKDEKPTAALLQNKSSIKIKYEQSVKLTFKLYNNNPKQFVLDYYGLSLKDMDDEMLEYFDLLVDELKDDPDYKTYLNFPTGKYCVYIDYYGDVSNKYDTCKLVFKLEK